MSRAVLTAAVLVAAVAPAVLSHAPAEAAASQPLSQEYDQQVYGAFRILGNSVMVCPSDNTTCTSAANRQTTPGASAAARANDGSAMRYADVDSDPSTFNSSSGTLTIPPGAQVDFAHLYWAGNTGIGANPDGSIKKPTCMGTVSSPVDLPDGSPKDQALSLAFGNAPATKLTGNVFVEDNPPANQAQFYSGDADVKSLLAAQPTGSPITVTVGNVWAPTGPGCFGGWSMIFVYKYPAADPTNAPMKREIFINAGHVKEGSTDPAVNVNLSGFTALSSVPSRVGMTAYEGDWSITGDTFAINGKNIPEPATKATDNFFVSAADGEVVPKRLNNFSVDAKQFDTPPGAIPAGSNSVTLTFDTKGDRYLVQNVVFSVPVPELRITKTADPAVAPAGSTVTFSITVTNPTEADASEIAVSDPSTPACNRTIGALAAGKSTTYTCTGTVAPGKDGAAYQNTASLSGSVGGEQVTGSSTVSVPVPSIGVAITPNSTQGHSGDTVTFTVKVTNNGSADLNNVAVADKAVPACVKSIGSLKAGDSATYTCDGKAALDNGGEATYTNSVTATGDPAVEAGATPISSVKADAIAVVNLAQPAISVTKTIAPPQVRTGDPVTITVTVTNTGNVPLTKVAVTDKDFPQCSKSDVGDLAPAAVATYDCSVKAPDDDVSTTSTATGQPPTGSPVSSTSDAVTVDVIHPGIKITKTPVPAFPNPGEPLAFIITVKNTGDVALSNVTVSDPAAPSCSRVVGTLAAGAEETCGCMITTPNADLTNTATVTGTPPSGNDVTDTSTVIVDVAVPAAMRHHQV